MRNDVDVLADRLFTAIEHGDLDVVDELYAPGIIVWHNTDGVEQTRDQNLRVLGWAVRHLHDRRYEHVRRHHHPGGFVQQHVFRATTATGRIAEVPACLVVSVRDDQVVRIDEYLDSAAIRTLDEDQ